VIEAFVIGDIGESTRSGVALLYLEFLTIGSKILFKFQSDIMSHFGQLIVQEKEKAQEGGLLRF